MPKSCGLNESGCRTAAVEVEARLMAGRDFQNVLSRDNAGARVTYPRARGRPASRNVHDRAIFPRRRAGGM